MKGFPKPEVATLHSHHKYICCPKCHKRWRECLCVLTKADMANLPDAPHQARDWGYKGVMRLPDTHPDSPNFKATNNQTNV